MTMRLDEACEPIFARHETFHPRLGWFRKAFLAAGRNQGDFFVADGNPDEGFVVLDEVFHLEGQLEDAGLLTG